MANRDLPLNSLALELPLTPAYHDEHAQLAQHSVPVTLDLGGGPRTFVSDPVSVGTYQGLEVRAQLRFDYEYRRDENRLVIRGNDDRTSDQLHITTFVSGAPDQSLGQEPNLVFHVMPNDIGQNLPLRNMWAAHVGQHPDLHAALANVASAANDRLAEYALDAGVAGVLQRGTPPVVTLDTLDSWKVMLGDPVTPETRTDRVGEVIAMQFRVDSIYKGTIKLSYDFQLANVIGSTGDPLPKGATSWIQLWQNKCNLNQKADCCTSINFAGVDPDWECSTDLVGGHVIPGKRAEEKAEGSVVLIYPICKRHNNNDDYYMEIKVYNEGVWLQYWITKASSVG